jgi:hypothetical protein
MRSNGIEVAAKRTDPGYMQIAGDVKKNTGLKFKAACTLNELTLGEGLEQAILLWLEQDELKKSLSQAKAKGDVV